MLLAFKAANPSTDEAGFDVTKITVIAIGRESNPGAKKGANLDGGAGCPHFEVHLPRAPCQEDNGAVRTSRKMTFVATAILGLSLAVSAQYQDRDTRGTPKTSAKAPPSEARTDINHATVDELLRVPGMTPTWAARIVRFRPYRTKGDLLDKGVVTTTVYDRIKGFVIAHREKQ